MGWGTNLLFAGGGAAVAVAAIKLRQGYLYAPPAGFGSASFGALPVMDVTAFGGPSSIGAMPSSSMHPKARGAARFSPRAMKKKARNIKRWTRKRGYDPHDNTWVVTECDGLVHTTGLHTDLILTHPSTHVYWQMLMFYDMAKEACS